MFLSILIAINVIVAIITAVYASAKGHSSVLWFFLGLVFGLIALLFLAIAADRRASVKSPTLESGEGENILSSPKNPARDTGQEIADQLNEKWELLKKLDPDIASISVRAIAVAPELDEIIARKFLILNDKSYLEKILQSSIQEFEDAADQVRREKAEMLEQLGSDAVAEAQRYEEFLLEGRLDPIYQKRVVSIDGYQGSWTGFRGGIIIELEDGSYILRRKGLTRRFKQGDNSWE